MRAPGYAARIHDIAARVADTPDQSGLLSLLYEGIDALGAQGGVFISFIRDSADVAACRFMVACDPAWCQRYLALGCLSHDPWLAYAAHHGEPTVASALQGHGTDAQRVTTLAHDHGFASTAVVPVHSGAGHSRISVLCLASATPGYFEDSGFARFKLGARTLAAELHEWWLARIRRELVFRARITAADMELLRYEHLGLSSKHIASALQVSVTSINSRFQRMNAKLGVANRRMAAQLAIECGLL